MAKLSECFRCWALLRIALSEHSSCANFSTLSQHPAARQHSAALPPSTHTIHLPPRSNLPIICYACQLTVYILHSSLAMSAIAPLRATACRRTAATVRQLRRLQANQPSLLAPYPHLHSLHAHHPSIISAASTARPASLRHFSSNKPESLEELAKRLSDEADAEFKASGKKSSVSSRIKQRPPVTQSADTSSAAAAADTSSSASADNTASATASSPSQSSDSTNAATDSTTSTSSSSASSTADSSSTTDSSSASTGSLLSTITREWGHIQDYIKKFRPASSSSTAKPKRSVEDILTRGPTILPSTLRPAGQPDEVKAADPAEGEPGAEQPVEGEKVGSGELVLVDSDTVWDKRLDRMRTSFNSSSAFLTFRKAKRTLIHSQNPILKPVHALQHGVRATLDDIRLTWETSQHPLVYRMRDVSDRLVGETEMAYALGEIMKVDPSFDLLSFHAEMEEYMIPVVITAYLRGTPADALMLKQCSEGLAANAIWRSLRERDAKGERYDDTILDISHVELRKAVMVKDTPVVELTFMVQQINCVRRLKGRQQQQQQQQQQADKAGGGGVVGEAEAGGGGGVAGGEVDENGEVVVSGSPSDIAQHFYVWIMRRDFENPDFDWKIMEMQSQQVFSLV